MHALASALADRYLIRHSIGHGGMATVYLADDVRHRRLVAVKVMHPELSRSRFAGRFLREIRIAARLTHPHILPLHDSGEVEYLLYSVMPYVDGGTLRQRLERGPALATNEATAIVRQVADALAYAHECGVVHRDIKPENILLAGQHAVVADFGIAKAIDVSTDETLTDAGMAVGSPVYMSPEQATGEGDLDGRSDIYSLGCVFYEMLAGTPPNLGGDGRDLAVRHARAPNPSMRLVERATTGAYGWIVRRALATQPADRFASAADLIAALDGVSPGRGLRRGAVAGPSVAHAADERLGLERRLDL